MELKIKEESGFRYVDEGSGQTMLLVHGLFGALSNWHGVVERFSKNYRVIIPMLPINEMPIRQAGLDGLVEFLDQFIQYKLLNDIILMGNSLGGHIGLIYTLKSPENISALILTGSSGLFENAMGGSYPKRGSYEYVKDRVEYTFFDPKVATKELVDEVFETTTSIPKSLRIVAIAKSAQRHNMSKELPKIKVPTCLIWGLNDTITPPMVAHEFNKLLPNSRLFFIDKCCHAPMMEHQDQFNNILEGYLQDLNKSS